jgi:predicted RNA binding protein YcfA (HicA-like mRNA interferase family)
MSKFDKLLLKLLSGNADNNFSFDELRNILLNLGFTERNTGGSHKIFYKDGIEEIINIQPKIIRLSLIRLSRYETLF